MLMHTFFYGIYIHVEYDISRPLPVLVSLRELKVLRYFSNLRY